MGVEFEPELGQQVWGQPYKRYACPWELEVALDAIRDTHTVLVGGDSPFSNTGAYYQNDTFTVEAYSWSDEEQPFNFKWRDVEVSWYKHSGRGASVNRELNEYEIKELLVSCLTSLLNATKGE